VRQEGAFESTANATQEGAKRVTAPLPFEGEKTEKTSGV
jgi:hypothetical protein